MINCEICHMTFKNKKCLGSHLCKSHKEITTKDYYDKYLLKKGENKCKNIECNNITKFIGLNDGYKKSYCSRSCARKSKEVNDKQRLTCLKLYGNATYRNVEKYKDTCLEKYGKENALCKGTSSYDKRNNTIKEKYGVDNVFKHPKIIEKIRNSNENNGYWSSIDKVKEYKEYYGYVKKITRRNSKELYGMWDGYDYYDKEYIKDNLNLDKNDNLYPSIDHKISVKECFLNNISPDTCGNIDNMCITKRIINIFKSNINSELFLKKILQNELEN